MTEKKQKVMIDNSVWSEFKLSEVEDFINLLKKKVIIPITCEVIKREIDRAREAKKELIINRMKQLNIDTVPITPECEALAKKYIKEKVLSSTKSEDALLIATTVVNKLDAIVTLNHEDMLRGMQRFKINKVNKDNGYTPIEFLSPKDVIEYAKEKE